MLGISDAVAEANLREQAKRALEHALSSDNEQVRLRAAQSLYSYRAAAPPAEPGDGGREDSLSLVDGRRVVNLGDILEFCLEEVGGIFETARMQDIILRAAERVRELQAKAVRV